MQDLDEHNPNDSFKEYMNWLRENDPMTYYEMTHNPSGTDSDGFGCVVILFFISFILYWIFG